MELWGGPAARLIIAGPAMTLNGSLEESRDDLHSSGYDTPDLTIRSDSYTTLLDATDDLQRLPRRRTENDVVFHPSHLGGRDGGCAPSRQDRQSL